MCDFRIFGWVESWLRLCWYILCCAFDFIKVFFSSFLFFHPCVRQTPHTLALRHHSHLVYESRRFGVLEATLSRIHIYIRVSYFALIFMLIFTWWCLYRKVFGWMGCTMVVLCCFFFFFCDLVCHRFCSRCSCSICSLLFLFCKHKRNECLMCEISLVRWIEVRLLIHSFSCARTAPHIQRAVQRKRKFIAVAVVHDYV